VDTRTLALLGPKNVCPSLAVGNPGVETPSRRNRLVLRRERRMAQWLVHCLRDLGCIASGNGNGVCRRTDRGGLWAGIGMLGSGMRLAGAGVGGDEVMCLGRQAVGVRPSRLQNSTVAAPLFTGLRQAQRTIRGSQPLVLWPHQSVADCFDWLGLAGTAWGNRNHPRARPGRTESESKSVGLAQFREVRVERRMAWLGWFRVEDRMGDAQAGVAAPSAFNSYLGPAPPCLLFPCLDPSREVGLSQDLKILHSIGAGARRCVRD
jgi:hypothetical protein